MSGPLLRGQRGRGPRARRDRLDDDEARADVAGARGEGAGDDAERAIDVAERREAVALRRVAAADPHRRVERLGGGLGAGLGRGRVVPEVVEAGDGGERAALAGRKAAEVERRRVRRGGDRAQAARAGERGGEAVADHGCVYGLLRVVAVGGAQAAGDDEVALAGGERAGPVEGERAADTAGA